MLSFETQMQLVKVMLTIARGENSLEVFRQILAEQTLFSPYTSFLRIDRKNKGYLDKEDLVNFLR
jgi:Ca2+-binding EF-hand superfamily protein